MSSMIKPINPNVSRQEHRTEDKKNVSLWFETEYLEINFGETEGRPSADVTLRKEYLAQFLQTGWSIDAVIEKGEGGNWIVVGGGTTYSKSQNFYPLWQVNDGFGTSSGWDHDLYARTKGITPLRERNYSYDSRLDTVPVSVSSSTSIPSSDSPAFWTAYQRIRLKRRRLIAERVMQSMTDSFTDAYNSGRSIEDSRYNEIVALYSLMLSRSEDEGNEIVGGATDIMPLANRLAESVMASVSDADSASSEISDVTTKNRERDVNRQFDGLIAQTKAQMITNGIYNSTMWPSVEAGIERQRSEALDKAKEGGISVKLNAKSSVANLKATVGAQILASMQGIVETTDKRKVTVVELRNTVLKWMLDYIGAREESYPELEEIATVAERMGFSVGSAGSVL